jgi:3-mercaptopyruvate sulfurtransferase SseA
MPERIAQPSRLPRGSAFRGLTGAVLLALSVFTGGCTDTLSDKDIETAPLAEVRRLHGEKDQSTRFIDPRPVADFAKGRIPGAVNLALPRVSDTPDSLSPELARYNTLVVYGDNPGAAVARAMTKRLMRAGAKNVLLFAGGLAEWSASGLSVESDQAVTPAVVPSR